VLTIRPEHVDALANAALERFEQTMVDHVRTYFPSHYRVLKDNGVRAVIRYGYKRAVGYRFDTQRAVCMYLNAMLLLGSNFDTDTMYPWAKDILYDPRLRHPRQRIDVLADRALHVFGEIAGPNRSHLNRALVAFRKDERTLLDDIGRHTLADLPAFASRMFPRKLAVIGDAAIASVGGNAAYAAARYGFTGPSQQLLYSLLMFVLGSGFDTDPQYASLHAVLRDRDLTDPQAKARALYAAAWAFLNQFLSAEQTGAP
jgi:hypothetical protein